MENKNCRSANVQLMIKKLNVDLEVNKKKYNN